MKSSGRPASGRGTASGGTGEMYGEGNWKADEEYRRGLKEFSETHDSEELAREAADDLDDEDEEAAPPKKTEGEGEW
ncbi:MAG: hypothetical protein ABJC61_10200 [Acidobacteriota bacterium]